MRPFLVFPSPAPTELARALDSAGIVWRSVATPDEVTAQRPDEGWGGAIVSTDRHSSAAWALCRLLTDRLDRIRPVILVVGASQLDELADHNELFDDFCITPLQIAELEKRVARAVWRTEGTVDNSALIEYEGLAINTETYQAAIDGAALELTHMEFELLKFLASNPGRVFTREVLLSRVWGYDYFGGARTVDVHIRRLRSKLGEDAASLIQTVRSVGYSFGESSWSS